MDAVGPVTRPALLGRFKLVEKLGSDAAGEIYRAVLAEGEGPAVVVHIVRAEGGGARRERLLRETGRAARVTHPGLAVVLDVGQTEEGDVFVAVEKLEGERLSDRLRGGASLPEHEAAEIAGQIARALAAAHDAGVVHRELHPSSIALRGAGDATEVRVEGLATPRLAGPSDLAFAAPEQRRGEVVGRRADVYSIGAMLHAMLTGKPPGPDGSQVEGALADVVRRSLADDPRERFLDTIALGAALRAAIAPAASTAPVSVRPMAAEPNGAAAPTRAPAQPPPRPLGRPLTARPRWEETLLDLRDGPLPRVAATIAIAFVIARVLTSGIVPFVVAIAAGVAAYAVKFWRS